jgi:hypothetical protein
MSDTSSTPCPATAELKIVPFPLQGDTWALVNREGDRLATGDYTYCARRLRRLTACPHAP